MFDKILVPIDFSHAERADTMIAQAKELASPTNSHLTLLNVVIEVPPFVAMELPADINPKAIAFAENKLRELAEKHGLAETTTILVQLGNPANEILNTAEKNNCNLIVIASHQPEIADYLLGSVAGRVVRHAHCTVMVLR